MAPAPGHPAASGDEKAPPAPGRRPLRRGFQAFPLFFPAAAVYAAVAVPIWVLEFLGWLPAWQPTPAGWHAHEMVFGYALAVVGGYLITKGSRGVILTAFGLWLAGRLAHFGPGLPAPVAIFVDLAYPAVLFGLAGLPFLRAAKSWRNALFGVIVAAFLLAQGLYHLGGAGLLAEGEERGLLLAIDLVILLLFAMGGRLIAATTSGALQRKGGHLTGAAQPSLERAGVLCLIAVALLDGIQWGLPVTAAFSALAGTVIVIRLVRWQAWKVIGVAEASVLHLGYAWLAAGLLVQAAGRAFDLMTPLTAAHGAMVGGLGVLSLAVMGRTAQQRLRRPLGVPPLLATAIGLMSLAVVLRVLASLAGPTVALLAGAAAAWSLAFVCFGVFLLRLLADRPETPPAV
ncbi:NnrS family protein [Shumkonia mesophila]|uniref:NnrS family protein n=1 Tax=Shumkonia mesophila TaxID=2838854 RepID=UPI002934B442|nr:NnrS family protein [Shumkonia mesophila]